jgi:hypothetical protein
MESLSLPTATHGVDFGEIEAIWRGSQARLLGAFVKRHAGEVQNYGGLFQAACD